LAQLAAALPKLRNYNVQVRELDNEVIFLHKIAPGNADKSYGIHVARLAGVPEQVLKRATSVLETLESRHELPVTAPTRTADGKPIVPPPEGPPRRKHKLKPQITGPTLFSEGDDVPFS
jgi:DNA mismatch repair protein MutS